MEKRTKLLPNPAAAEYLNCSEAKLNQDRSQGTGATFVKMGGSVFYTIEDLDAYIASRRVTDTAQARALQADNHSKVMARRVLKAAKAQRREPAPA